MKKMILLLLVTIVVVSTASAQFADPATNVIVQPDTLIKNSAGLIRVGAFNTGNSVISKHTIELEVTIGANATITGVDNSSATGWTITSLSSGNGNTIKLQNTNSELPVQQGAIFFLNITATDPAASGLITSTIGYIGTGSALPGDAPNATQGNGQTNNDLSFTSLKVNNPAPLPVGLYSFGAIAEKCQAILSWNVAQNEHVDFYVIERSNDGKSFSSLQKIAASMESGKVSYQQRFEQQQVNAFYRLNMLSRNGSNTYSNTVRLQTKCNKSFIIAYPNPVKDLFSLRGLIGGESIRIYNSIGQLISKNVATEAGFTTNMSRFPAGPYRVIIDGQDHPTVVIPIEKVD